MENKKILVEKELNLEKKKIEEEIELLKQEKEKYGFDYDAMEKTLKNVKYITISNVAIASLCNVINPFIGTIGYPLFAGAISNLEESLIEKYHIKGDKLGIFSSKEKIKSNYEKILNIDFEIEKANLKNKIIDKAIDINKEDYKPIDKDLFKNNDKDINLLVLKNVALNDDFLNGEEIDYSGKTFLKSSILDGFGGGVVCLSFLPTSAIAFGVGTIASLLSTGVSHARSLSIIRESNDKLFKNLNIVETCNDLKNEFLDSRTNEGDKINGVIREINLDNIIEEEAYKKLDEYNSSENIGRKRKIDEYYKKKEEIIRYLNSNSKENKIEKTKVKVLQKL